jgi:hypothetical protein
MNLLRKVAISLGIVAAATLLLALTSPRAMHALGPLGAELVRITNTASAPANVEDVSHLASHLVMLNGFMLTGNEAVPFYQVSANGVIDFVIPAGQSFVITSVDVGPCTNPSTQADIYLTNASSNWTTWYGEWDMLGWNTLQFQYPTGIAVASGTTIYLNATQQCSAQIRGYMTPN